METMKLAFVHFSYRHVKKDNKILMAVVVYCSVEPKSSNIVGLSVSSDELWDGHSNIVKAMQAYENALSYIYSKQESMREAGFTNAVLVTSNRILHKSIKDGKNRYYNDWLDRANAPYRAGGMKEITIPVGLCAVAESDMAYKYCSTNMLNCKISKTNRGIHTDKKGDDDTDAVRTMTVDEYLERYNYPINIEYGGMVAGFGAENVDNKKLFSVSGCADEENGEL